MHRPLLVLATALAALTACSENELVKHDDNYNGNGPVIEVDPQFLQFGELAAEEQEIRTFTIHSVGGDNLEVTDIEIGAAGAASFTILDSQTEFIMAPGEFQEIEVAFSPLGAQLQSAEVIVSSNDPEAPHVTVDLEGAGLVPELQITPNPYDFGTTYVGCATEGLVTLTNVGTDALTITEMAHLGDGFEFVNPHPMPIELQPEEFVDVILDFDPDIEGTFNGSLTVVSTEPMGTREATQTGVGQYAAAYQDLFQVPTNPPSDIMFLVDQSCSMDANQVTLANNFSYFISNLSNYTNNWQVMVVNNDDGCNSSGILTQNSASYADRFRSSVSAGGGSYTEALLTPAARATGLTNSSQCNAGFMRSNALLHIIMVSDEPEQSPETWSTLVNRIISYKGSAALVKLSAIVGDVPNGCSGGGDADAGTGYYEAANYTGGEFLSICASSWTSYMSLLAEASISQDRYELSATPLEHTIEVWVNGSQRYAGWHYDAASNSVVFDSAIPEGGDAIRVEYAGSASCD